MLPGLNYAANIIETEARRNHNLRPQFPSQATVASLRIKEVERIQLTVLRPLSVQTVTGEGLRQISETLNGCASKTRFKLDQELLYQLSKLTSEAAKYWIEQDYIERRRFTGE